MDNGLWEAPRPPPQVEEVKAAPEQPGANATDGSKAGIFKHGARGT